MNKLEWTSKSGATLKLKAFLDTLREAKSNSNVTDFVGDMNNLSRLIANVFYDDVAKTKIISGE